MYLLAIDTATNSGGVALSRNNEVIGLLMAKTPLKYSDHLIYYIEFLLKHLGISINQMDCIAVASGPGSFTGLRIGLAMVKGLAQPSNLATVGIPTLSALAFRFRNVKSLVAPMIDARRQQIYGGIYQVTEESVEAVDDPLVRHPADWLRTIKDGDDYLFVGDGAEMYHQTIQSVRPGAHIIRSDNSILTELCQLGYQQFVEGKAVSAFELKALYIRPSDAEMNA